MENPAYIGIYRETKANYPENEQKWTKIPQKHHGAIKMLPLSSPERLKRYHQGKETEMACEYAKRMDHGWECINAKKPCRYPIPDRSLCSEEYKWIKDIGKRIEEHEIDAESLL